MQDRQVVSYLRLGVDREVAGRHLCPGCAHLNEALIDHLQQLQELFVLIVKAAPKDNRTDNVGDSAAQEESGFGGGTWMVEIVYVGGNNQEHVVWNDPVMDMSPESTV